MLHLLVAAGHFVPCQVISGSILERIGLEVPFFRRWKHLETGLDSAPRPSIYERGAVRVVGRSKVSVCYWTASDVGI